MIARLMKTPATLTTPGAAGAPDRFGNATATASSDVATLCQVAYGGGAENNNLEVEQCLVFMPVDPGAQATAKSTLTLADGTVIEFVEPPRKPVRATSGAIHHVEVKGRVVT